MKNILCSAFGNANWYIHFGKQFDIMKCYSPINLGPAFNSWSYILEKLLNLNIRRQVKAALFIIASK